MFDFCVLDVYPRLGETRCWHDAWITEQRSAHTTPSCSIRRVFQLHFYTRYFPLPMFPCFGIHRLDLRLFSSILLSKPTAAVLFRLLRKPRPAALRNTIAALLSRCVRHATYIVPTAGQEPDQPLNARGGGGGNGSVAGGQKITNANESQADGDGHTAAGGGGLVGALVATIRERPAPGRAEQAAALRRNAMAALGELLFYVVSQEPAVAGRPTSCGGGGRGGRGGNDGGGGSEARSWHLPITAVGGAIEICLEDAAHDGVCHYAAKTLENVLAQAGPSHPLVGVLVTQTLALCLFDLAR